MNDLAHTRLYLCLIKILLMLEDAVLVWQLLGSGIKPRVGAFESSWESKDSSFRGVFCARGKTLLKVH